MISGLYLRLGIAAAILALLGGLWGLVAIRGRQRDQARAEAAQWRSAADGYKAAWQHERQAYAISDKAASAFAQASQRVEVQTRTLVQKVPIYVTPETDARCFVPVGLVRVWNAAATGSDPGAVPIPAGLADGDASGIACSELASDIATAFGDARQNTEQLKALQGWITDQIAAAPPP